MAYFARRAVKRSLDLLRRGTLSATQVENLVAQLNSRSRHVVTFEWEAIAVAAFVKHCEVAYEPQIRKGNPDLYVRNAGENRDITFVADVAMVSDHGIEERNAHNFLYEAILDSASKLDIDFSTLGWHVGYRMEGQFPDRRVQVLLPRKAELHRRIEQSVRPFLRQVQTMPYQKHELIWKENQIDFRLTYDPCRRQSDFGGPIIPTVPYSKTDNSLYKRLRKKAEDLSKTKFTGMRGIILGDGDCYALQRTADGNGSSYHARNIVRTFLEKHPSVTFVTTSHYEHETNFSNRGHGLRHTVYFQPSLSDNRREQLLYFLDDVFGEIPRPIQSPNNAIRDVLGRRELSRGIALGAYHWSPPRLLKLPVRVFLGLVAGSLSKCQFNLLFYQTMPREGGPLVSFFGRVLLSRATIQNVFVEPTPERDDDWIVFDCSPREKACKIESATDSLSCEIPTQALIKFFAGLDYGMQCGEPNQSRFQDVALSTRQCVKNMLDKGRLLQSAQLHSQRDVIELRFGDRDAAISAYW